jgi:DNA-binding transcriptional MerR regulator
MTTVIGVKIGEVARKTGVAVGALRYYENLGLIASQRGDNGYRYYDPVTIQQVQFIKKAQALGFSLEDIREILTVYHHGDLPCELVRSRLDQKIQQLETQIQDMMHFKAELETYRDLWAGDRPHLQSGNICPLIESIDIKG